MYILGLLGISQYHLHWDALPTYTLFTSFFQYYTLQKVQTFWEAFQFRTFCLQVLGLSFFQGYVAMFALQIAYLLLIWVMRAWQFRTYWKTTVLLFLL